MSFDLAVFDPEIAPDDRKAFLAWYNQQTQWTELTDYNDPANLSPRLSSFFHELTQNYPPMNGPLASDDDDDSNVTDYSLARGLIYASFAWSVAERARQHTSTLAAKHAIGFFDVSAEGGLWLPDGRGGLTKMA